MKNVVNYYQFATANQQNAKEKITLAIQVIGTGGRATAAVAKVTEPKLFGIRASMVWTANKWVPNTAVGFFRGFPVNPSKIGQIPPDAESVVRTENCASGYLEDCILYKDHSGKSFVAYKKADGRYLPLPGVNEPVSIDWQTFASDGEEGCIARIPFDNGKSYLTVFPGDDEFIAKSPNPILTKPWSGLPTVTESTLCWIHWRVSNKGVPIGYAYNHIENSVGYEESFQYLKQFHINLTLSRISVIAENLSAVDSLRAFVVDGSIVIAIVMVEPVDEEITCQRYADNFYVKGSAAGMVTIVPKWVLESDANIKVVSDGQTLWIIYRGNIN